MRKKQRADIGVVAWHSTFYMREGWPRKGISAILTGEAASVETAVTALGVGRNMVPALWHWLLHCGLVQIAP